MIKTATLAMSLSALALAGGSSRALAWPAACQFLFDKAALKKETLSRLASEIAKDVRKNELFAKNGKTVLRVEYINVATQRPLLTAAYDAIKAGAIDEIDAGIVVGPKVVPLLAKLQHLAPKDHSLVIRGGLSPRDLVAKMISWAKEDPKNAYMPRHRQISEAESMRIYDSFEELGVDQACKDLYRTSRYEDCRDMKFAIDSMADGSVRWSAR